MYVIMVSGLRNPVAYVSWIRKYANVIVDLRIETGRCPFSQLESFLSGRVGIQTTNQNSLQILPSEPGLVLNGSFVVFSCINGYVNTGGSLNVTCGNNGAWSPFPNCVQSSGSGATMTMPPVGIPTSTTMMPTGGSGGTPCFIDRATTFSTTNGFPSSSLLTYRSDSTATGFYRYIFRWIGRC